MSMEDHAPVARPMEPAIVTRARAHGDRLALSATDGEWTYRDLVDSSGTVALRLLGDRLDLAEARVGLSMPAGGVHVAALWGIWRAGGVVAPLSQAATATELTAFLEDITPECILSGDPPRSELVAAAERAGIPILLLDRQEVTGPDPTGLPAIDPGRRGMILCTSGTTSRPKGVVTTHATITAQIESLVEAWRWTEGDRIPLFLPLHHIHGIINVLSCCLWAGGRLDAFERFDAAGIVDRVTAGRYTLFMAVPTIYVRLIELLDSLPPARRQEVADGFAALRLGVSGSAALPARMHDRWADLTGQRLLERYGMTEIGMALSHRYDGERRAGTVGEPLPSVEVRLVDDRGEVVVGEDTAGEIQVRGPTVFLEYWLRPEATRESFTDGWFRSGDIAVRERGQYRILGRSSTDIIKSGGYKLSALEIEAALLDHPAISGCAVVGLADATWGEVVAAAIVPTAGSPTDPEDVRAWCRGRLSPYRIPRIMLVVDALPRNAMGKCDKSAVRRLFAVENVAVGRGPV
ncbi:MAG: acyl-CoA synthetase [Pirellulales bacterium]